MIGYFIRFFIANFLILLVIGLGLSAGISFRADIAALLLIALVLYWLDATYLAVRRAKLAAKLNELFSTTVVTEDVVSFRFNSFDIYARIAVDYKKGFQFANVETISFHIPAEQYQSLPTRPAAAPVRGEVGTVPTLLIFQTKGTGLEEARDKLKKLL